MIRQIKKWKSEEVVLQTTIQRLLIYWTVYTLEKEDPESKEETLDSSEGSTIKKIEYDIKSESSRDVWE
jgi:hypothetical protein